MDVNLPEVKAEVVAAFVRYETALMANDVATLQALFWNSPHTIRYGINEILHGWDEIGAFRSGRSTVGLARTISRTVITTFGRDFATASTLFHRDTVPAKVGRQQQSWARFEDGWHCRSACQRDRGDVTSAGSDMRNRVIPGMTTLLARDSDTINNTLFARIGEEGRLRNEHA